MTDEDIFRALDYRIRELEAELSLMLEYFKRGVPYWYGIAPVDRIRSILKGKVHEEVIKEMRMRVRTNWRKWVIGVSWGRHWPTGIILSERVVRYVKLHLLVISVFISFPGSIG